ncbi:lipopolysaccharide biosynthesis protein [Devosia algicola]|uniref:Lipopolysaccharide biosynthesis protein n=1 Tax=Devosia algicola TaxID=3026418 RepID=A0ABY7YKJ7_9HYPH|nr:lipopolysaccharide biosynthesis protein [Devosia algicola]WDR01729.1 lipopolysaccharide biosynthesis protein [Devosia algicola]
MFKTVLDKHSVAGLMSGMMGLLRKAHSIALLDQIVVSGTSFVATVAVARAGSAHELGAYAIAISILAVLISFQDSVVLTPYTVHRDHSNRKSREQAGAAFGLSVGLAGVGIAGLLLIGLVLGLVFEMTQVARIVWALAFAAPFVLLREFGRRYAFAHMAPMHAVIQDAVAVVLQLGALALLFVTGQMTASTAILALGFACLVTDIGWYFRFRRDMVFDRTALRKSWGASWNLGKWLAGSRLGTNIQGYVSYWLTTMFFGAATTGVYAASMTIVSFSNPIIFGLGNVLTPRTALAWKTGGASALWRVAIVEARLLAVLASAFAVLVMLVGDQIMLLLYHGSEFAGQGQTLIVLSLAMIALALGRPAASGLATLERSKEIFNVAVFATLITLVLAVVLTFTWGLVGAATGYLAGNLLNTAGRWVVFHRALRVSTSSENDITASINAIIADFEADGASASTMVTKIGAGDHATAFMVSSSDGTPVWQSRDRIVVKLFNSDGNTGQTEAQVQFTAMAELHKSFGPMDNSGWTVEAAQPLKLCQQPPAIVMEKVGGAHFDRCDWHGEPLRQAAGALVNALSPNWKSGRAHGDFGLQNVLFDLCEQRMGLIDPGTYLSCPSCHLPTGRPMAAALDMGHLLADLARDQVHRRGGSTERSLRQAFVINFLKAGIASAGARHEQAILMAAVKSSAIAHMEELVRRANGVKWLWLRAVLPIKCALISTVLAKV